MGKIKKVLPVKIFCGMIYRKEELVDKIRELLSKRFGKVDIETEPFPFDFTDYYEKEMGKTLKRKFFSFEKLAILKNISEWKIYTNTIEKQFLTKNTFSRTVNLDPGYLTLAKVILLSTKNYYHRIYLENGIYAEGTLYFTKDNYSFFPWTYPDYKNQNYLDFFRNMRNIYKEQIEK